jgi:tetratricopeptide (TPR) repeat protein
MRVKSIVLILWSLTAIGGCDRDPERKSATTAPPTVVYRGSDGRTLSQDELKDVTGTFNYEIVGGEDVPAKARELHEQARAAGSRGEYDKAIVLLQRASEAAPRWPYPVYDMAYTYLLKKDFDNARVFYRKTLELSPRGFFTAITARDALEREQNGEFPSGLYLAYLSLEWMDNQSERAAVVRQLSDRQPGFAPGIKERALLAEKDDERLSWIEKGLSANPDAETKGILLINKALLLNKQGNHVGAVKLLGQLALDPQSTFATEHLAKATLANIAGMATTGGGGARRN